MDKAPDNKSLAGSNIPFPFESEFGRRLVMGDIAYYDVGERKTDAELGVDAKGKQIKFDHQDPAHYNVVPKLNKLGKIPNKTSWDSFSYALYMGHNVYCHITAVQRANHLADIEHARFKRTWRDWEKLNGKDSSKDEPSPYVPRNILYFEQFVAELFETKTKAEAFALIEEAKTFITSLDGARLQGGPARNKFHSLFEVEEVTNSDEIDVADPNDAKLVALEQQALESKE